MATATNNSTETKRARLLEAISDELSKKRTLLCSCRRMTDPLDMESLQIDEMALGSLSQAIERVAFCNDDLGGAS